MSGELNEKHREFDLDEEATEATRERLRGRREAESVTYEEFFEDERERVTDGDVADPVAEMYTEVFDLSESFEREFHDYWDVDRSGF